jgi:polygalacturonase
MLFLVFASVSIAWPLFDVTSFGAIGDGVTLNTKPFTAAIAACEQAGGGTVYFPVG